MADPDPQTAPQGRRWGRLVLMLAVPLALVVGAVIYWMSLQGKVTTDNAYVKQDKVSVSSLVGGTIVDVLVKENETVRQGQLLFRIDPQPYEIDLAQANAQIATAQADLTALGRDAALSGADISAAREEIAFAQSRLERQKALWDRGFTTKADLDAAEHAVAQAREQLRAAEARQTEAQAKLANGAAVPGQNPRIAAAQAQKAAAQLDLSRTEIRAPMAGRVGQADRLQPGQQVLANLPVLTLVGLQGTYVEANFKETDLADMKVGQPAEIRFDAYPDLKLKGHVASIGAGTNSEFSLLPAQNASANWVKVTQRVPVRIELDDKSPRALIAGLSVDVTVFTNGKKR
ncbi:MAG: secretion protein HlyD [Sphingomonadales bacterium 63-6]|mgnify:CR=1 FL=1|nr:MAG: secretion protein HlyD [Sphingomonadales bacterium 63-6]